MEIFVDVCKQLFQSNIPMFADEKMYAIIKEIHMLSSDEFVLIIACQDAEKAMLKCLGIYLKGSGAESFWLEAYVYGPNVIENSLITAGNYNRALHGMSLLAQCVDRLILKEFFQEKVVMWKR